MLFVLPGFDQKIGGCHVVIDLCNAAARLGVDFQLAVLSERKYSSWSEPLFFEPHYFASEQEFAGTRRLRPRAIVATAWHTVVPAKALAHTLGAPCAYFVQGYEFYFRSGAIYRAVEDTFDLAGHVFTTSDWLKSMIARHRSGAIEVLPPGYDERLFNPLGRIRNEKPRITMALRGTTDKGQPFLIELLDRLSPRQPQIEVTLLSRDDIALPALWADRCEVRRLPARRAELAEVFRRTDIFIDGSLHEGFGLMPLEALACGCAVVASDSGGVAGHVRHGENGFLVSEVNRPERFLESVEFLLDRPDALAAMQQKACASVEHLSADSRFQAYVEYLGGLGCQPREASPRGLDPQVLLRWSETLGRLRTGTPPMNGAGGLEARVAALEQSVADIQQSRIWRTLCRIGALLMRR